MTTETISPQAAFISILRRIGGAILLLACTGCGGAVDAVHQVNETARQGIESLDHAIEEIGRGVDSIEDLQALLTEVKHDLDEGAYKRQIDDLMSSASQAIAIGGRDALDFVRTRAREDLIALKHALMGQEPPARVPHLTIPSTKRIAFPDRHRDTLQVIGWNLDVASADRERYHVRLLCADGERVVPDEHVHYMGQYAVTVDISTSGVELRHFDKAVRFMGYGSEFSVPVTDSAPPPGPVIEEYSDRASVKTTSDHARLERADWDVGSDDWTRVTTTRSESRKAIALSRRPLTTRSTKRTTTSRWMMVIRSSSMSAGGTESGPCLSPMPRSAASSARGKAATAGTG